MFLFFSSVFFAHTPKGIFRKRRCAVFIFGSSLSEPTQSKSSREKEKKKKTKREVIFSWQAFNNTHFLVTLVVSFLSSSSPHTYRNQSTNHKKSEQQIIINDKYLSKNILKVLNHGKQMNALLMWNACDTLPSYELQHIAADDAAWLL